MTDSPEKKLGGREETAAIIPGRYAISVGDPRTPLPEGWRWRKLTEIARLESGHTPSRRKPEYWDGHIPWVGIRDATGNHGRVLADTLQHVTQAGIDNSAARLLPANTVCLSRTASVGYVIAMGQEMATSQDFVNWICGPELDWRYLKHVLLSEREAFFRFASGTTHQTVYFPEVKAFHIALPPRDEQSRIAAVLGALEDKRQAEEGVVATSSKLLDLVFERAVQRAGDEAVDSLATIADFVNGGAFTKGASGIGRPVLRIRELNAGRVDSTTVRSDRDVADKHLARTGDLLFSWSGTLDTYRWYGEESIINQHIFKVLPTARESWEVELWLNHHLKRFRRIAADKAVTMGHIRRGDLAEAAVMPLDDQDRASLDAVGPAVASRCHQARQECVRLDAIGTLLLPKLISGAIRVPDTTDDVEAMETVVDAVQEDAQLVE